MANESRTADGESAWKQLRSEYKRLEQKFDLLTKGWSVESLSSMWRPAEAFADQAGMDRLRCKWHHANYSLSFAIELAGSILKKAEAENSKT